MTTQQGNSRAAVERLLAEPIPADAATAAGLVNQIRLHAELAGLSAQDVATLAAPAAEPAKLAKTAKPDGA